MAYGFSRNPITDLTDFSHANLTGRQIHLYAFLISQVLCPQISISIGRSIKLKHVTSRSSERIFPLIIAGLDKQRPISSVIFLQWYVLSEIVRLKTQLKEMFEKLLSDFFSISH